MFDFLENSFSSIQFATPDQDNGSANDDDDDVSKQ